MGQRQQTQNFFVKNGSVARLGIYGLRIEDFKHHPFPGDTGMSFPCANIGNEKSPKSPDFTAKTFSGQTFYYTHVGYTVS